MFNFCSFSISAQVVPGLLVLIIIYSNCDRTLVLVTWFTAVTLITAAYAGAMANIVDIAPNFAGTIIKYFHEINYNTCDIFRRSVRVEKNEQRDE